MIGRTDVERIRKIYLCAGLPAVAPNLGPEKYLSLMGLDKKVEGGNMRFILLQTYRRGRGPFRCTSGDTG